MSKQDKMFLQQDKVEDFTFDARVAQVFDDMVSRSVPYYNETQRMQTELIMDFIAADDSLVCDLGCSTGTTIDLISKHPNCPDTVKFVGYDNSDPMLDKARAKLADLVESDRIELLNADLSRLPELPRCDAVIMNWTLQFVRPIDREILLRRIYSALKPGGAFFLSDKVLGKDSVLNRLFIRHYLHYKTSQSGYSDTENLRKREALENVLVPYRLDENYALLERSGFQQFDTYFRWLNFACILAVKE